MTKSRIKVAPQPVLTRSEMETELARIASMKVLEQRHIASMNGEIETVKIKYAPTLDSLSKEIDLCSVKVREWAEANPADFGKLRSLDLTHAIIGWRTGMPTLKTIKGWTWDRVLETMKPLTEWQSYLRIAPEIDKQAIIADRTGFQAHDLREIGVEVKQAETFFIEAKIAQPEKREVA